MKFIRGEDNNLIPGTIGMIQASIAKKLVDESPDLASPDRQKDLMQAMEAVYRRDHAVVIHLDEAHIALVKMMATHEDDLPQA